MTRNELIFECDYWKNKINKVLNGQFCNKEIGFTIEDKDSVRDHTLHWVKKGTNEVIACIMHEPVKRNLINNLQIIYFALDTLKEPLK
jgi:hypothetical protein